MKIFRVLLCLFCCVGLSVAYGQADSAKAGSTAHYQYTHRDSLNLGRLNTTSNLMIAGGVGLLAAGSYLIVEGVITYNSPIGTSGSTIAQNHSQGAGYIAGGVIGIAAGIVMGAFGIKKKLEFKKRFKRMQLQSGLLDNGNLGAMLTF
jgi:hypothetical protein